MDLTRRRFSQIAATLGFFPGHAGAGRARADAEIAQGSSAAAGSAGTAVASPRGKLSIEPEVLRFTGYGWMPNNPHLPALLYRNVLRPHGSDPAAQFEALFARNGWPPQWRNGVYSFHHYHSTAHEVMGVASGEAELLLGGENGVVIMVRAGDVVLLPTGTGHCRISASDGFLVVGAYPPDQHWDICRSAPSPDAQRRMRSLPFPASDPVCGAAGPMPRLWSESAPLESAA
jgi:uncharacterized protein YjlB